MTKVNINSINRLNNIMNEIMQVQTNVTIKKMWEMVFKLKDGENIKLLKLLADVNELVKSIKKDISQMKNINQSIYLEPIYRIERAFMILNLDLPISSFKNVLGTNINVSFAYCVDVISREQGPIDIDSENIEDIRQDVEKLMKEIIESEIVPELKNVFIRNLNNIMDAINYYKINGIDGLQISVENTIGSFICYRDMINKNDKNVTVEKFFSILGKMFEIIKAVNTILTIGQPILNQLLGK